MGPPGDAAAESLHIVGDPDQCQPAGTMVETTTAPVRIEDLDPELHQILTWDRHSQAILGHRKQYGFEKAVRNYSGKLLSISAGDKKSKCTADHRWWVKWSNKNTGNCCVYLMRQGGKWRIGCSRCSATIFRERPVGLVRSLLQIRQTLGPGDVDVDLVRRRGDAGRRRPDVDLPLPAYLPFPSMLIFTPRS